MARSARYSSLALLLVLVCMAPHRTQAVPTCGAMSAPDCGGDAGDALCEAGQDCFDTGSGCACRPRVCCKCESADADSTLCDATPCTNTVLGSIFLCAAPCLIIDAIGGQSCNLKVVNQATCAGDDCPTTGCCTVALDSASQQPNADAAVGQFCAETDQATCDRFALDDDSYGSTFVPGGSCTSLSGSCIAPTATASATATATQTPTASASPTPTATVTASATPTKAANGADCSTPDQCTSGFCSDDVCCDKACDGPAESCDQPGMRGRCLPLHAPAPPMSRRGLVSFIALLTAGGVLSFSRRRRLGAAATHGAQ